ncbi:MAG TPA: YraN family protein [Lacipirellulaceae bacterium]|jgi:putative endonuclease|nr:YraN family protein [Lacipirellulaceae bacterium]
MAIASSLRAWIAARISLRKSLGLRGEDAASRYLKRQGFRIIERGYDSPLGEIDIIAIDERTVVFVEVKTRTSGDAGHPTEAIDATKQRRMTQAALAYLKSKRLLQNAARFDVVAINWPTDQRQPTIEHYQNAFAPTGSGQFFS